ncbi:hypothetical protein ONZ51_g3697 [Trametes cubensis]|uniref:Ubiquitin 3 binding protein But2 C-terminal domain-containing protein n=1 Tax=Trametes cubensis TaxID=1111947 RepID=A0AAD7XD83_9APHY|nr:hypothetical protein ONZ51_g3697 [Trametes cubensis]
MSPNVEYTALPRKSSSEKNVFYEPLLKNEVESSTRHHDAGAGANRVLFWSTIGVGLTTAVSLLLSIFALVRSHSSSSVVQLSRRPNPYVYLDTILINTTRPIPSINNFPQVVLQVHNADSSRRMHESDRQRPTAFGTVYPDDRRIFVTDTMSTVAQFRNLDYAMESCVLFMSLPAVSATYDPEITLTPDSVIDVWILDESVELAQDMRGSLDRAAARRELLATLAFPASGAAQTKEFLCPSRAFTTLELTCSPKAASGCHVDFWQDRRGKPISGVYIVQSSTPIPRKSFQDPWESW